jgi:hypothetical protein
MSDNPPILTEPSGVREAQRFQRLARWIPLLLIAAVVLTYCRTIGNEFTLWDDQGTIVENHNLAPPTVHGLLEHWRGPHMDLYVPATYTLWWVIAKASWRASETGGWLDPRWFHIASIASHALTTLVVFAVLKRFVQKDWPAAAGAMLFALHPVQVETVAWISGAKDLLAGLLVLTAVWQYVLFASSSRRRGVHYTIATLALALALLAKPIAVVTPVLVVLVDRLILRRQWRQVARSAGPWFVLVVPCLVWTKLCQPSSHVPAPALWQRPLIAADAIAFYVFKLAAPINLAPDYGRRPIDVLAKGWVYWTWLVPATIALAMWWRNDPLKRAARFSGWNDPRQRSTPVVLTAALFATFALLPLLGLVPFDFQVYSTTADHYLYIPMAGVALAAAWAVSRIRWRGALPMCASCLTLLAFLSAGQTAVWHDTQSLFEHTLAVNPDSYAAYSNLATLALRQAREQEVQAQTARLVFDTSTEATCRAEVKRLNEKYLAYAQQAYRVRPQSIQTRRRMGDALMRLDRPLEALRYLREAVAAWEKLPEQQKHKYATTHHLLAIALQRTGRLDEAAACCQRTLAFLPDYGPAQSSLAEIRASQARARPVQPGDLKTAAGEFDLPRP